MHFWHVFGSVFSGPSIHVVGTFRYSAAFLASENSWEKSCETELKDL